MAAFTATVEKIEVEYNVKLETAMGQSRCADQNGTAYEVDSLYVTLASVKEADGEKVLWIDVTAFGYHLTKKGNRDKRIARGRVHPRKEHVTTTVNPDTLEITTTEGPSPYLTGIVYPVLVELLRRHPEFSDHIVAGVYRFTR